MLYYQKALKLANDDRASLIRDVNAGFTGGKQAEKLIALLTK